MNVVKWIFAVPILLIFVYIIGIFSPIVRIGVISGITEKFKELEKQLEGEKE